jgi:hypothetical protein
MNNDWSNNEPMAMSVSAFLYSMVKNISKRNLPGALACQLAGGQLTALDRERLLAFNQLQ